MMALNLDSQDVKHRNKKIFQNLKKIDTSSLLQIRYIITFDHQENAK